MECVLWGRPSGYTAPEQRTAWGPPGGAASRQEVMARRSDNPLVILGLGVLAIVFFGGTIVFFNGRTPVLQLRASLRQTFQSEALQARFVRGLAGGPPHVLVLLPSESEADRERLWEIGFRALTRYRELAKGTQVERCVVKIAQRDPGEAVWVSLEQVTNYKHATAMLPALQDELRLLKLEPELSLKGYAQTGVRLHLDAPALKRDTSTRAIRRRARKALEVVVSYPFVGEASVSLKPVEGEVVRVEGGRDHRRVEPKEARKPRGKTARRSESRKSSVKSKSVKSKTRKSARKSAATKSRKRASRRSGRKSESGRAAREQGAAKPLQGTKSAKRAATAKTNLRGSEEPASRGN